MSHKGDSKSVFFYICDDDECSEKAGVLTKAVHDEGFDDLCFPTSDHPSPDDVISKLDECCCLVCVVCEHTMEADTRLVKEIERNDRLQDVVLTKTDRISCEQMTNCKTVYDISQDLDMVVEKITSTANAAMKYVSKTSTKRDKRNVLPKSTGGDAVEMESAVDRFIDAETMLPGRTNSSIMIRENLCCRVDSPRPAKEITDAFNTGCNHTREQIKREVMCYYRPNFITANDFISMKYLLGCACYRMKDAILRGISRILLKMDVSRQSLDSVFKLEGALWDEYFSHSNDEFHSAERASAYLEGVFTMHLRSSNFGHLSEDGIGEWETSVRQLFSGRIKALDNQVSTFEKQDTMSRQVAECVKLVLRTVFAKSGQLSSFYFGDLENALKHENNRSKMETMSKKLKYYEQFEMIFYLLCGFNRSESEYILDVLRAVCKNIFSSAFAKTYHKTMLQVFCCRLIVTLLTGDIKHHFRSNSSKLRVRKPGKFNTSTPSASEVNDFCHSLATILVESVTLGIAQHNDNVRKHLLEVLFPLVYHGSETVSAVIRHHIELFHTRLDLRRYAYEHIENALLLVDVHTQPSQGNSKETILTGYWEGFSSTISEKKGCGFLLQPSWTINSLQTFMKNRKGNKDEYIRNIEVLLKLPRKHESISNLLAYSINSPPFFFIKDDFTSSKSKNFSDYLLELYNKEYMNIENLDQLLLGLVISAVSAIDFLHCNGYIHRDVSARRFNVTANGANIKLADFRHARSLDGGQTSGDPAVSTSPVRWTAPESLLSNLFSVASDTYMIGAFMIEVFCLGLQPYTEHYSKPLDELLELIVFHNLRPIHHPCIPAAVYRLSLRCMDPTPSARISLEKLLSHLNSSIGDGNPNTDHSVLSMFRKDKYPDMDPRQRKIGEPETEIPFLFKFYRNERDPYGTYYNTKADKRRPNTHLAVTEQELTAADKPLFAKTKAGLLNVEERVEDVFVEEIWPGLRNLRMPSIVTSSADLKHEGGFGEEKDIHTLVYDCRTTQAVSKVAPTLTTSHLLQIIYLTARTNDELHRNGIIHRDITAENVYIRNDPLKHRTEVCLLRLNKMRRVKEGASIRAAVPEDSWRWDPLEALMHGIYSYKSESYRLAMFAWVCFTLKEIYKYNSRPNRMRAVPYNTLMTKEELLARAGGSLLPFLGVYSETITNESSYTQKYVYSRRQHWEMGITKWTGLDWQEVINEQLVGNILPKPSEECPDWLYRLMARCWSRESSLRPSVEEITREMYSRIRTKSLRGSVSFNNGLGDSAGSEDASVVLRNRSSCLTNTSAARRKGNSLEFASASSAHLDEGTLRKSFDFTASGGHFSNTEPFFSNASSHGSSTGDDQGDYGRSFQEWNIREHHGAKGEKKKRHKKGNLVSRFVGKFRKNRKETNKLYADNESYRQDLHRENDYESLSGYVMPQPDGGEVLKSDECIDNLDVLYMNINFAGRYKANSEAHCDGAETDFCSLDYDVETDLYLNAVEPTAKVNCPSELRDQPSDPSVSNDSTENEQTAEETQPVVYSTKL